jgi:hypothetical protein
MELLMMQFSPVSKYLFPLKPKYLSHHPILNTLSPCSYLSMTD